DEPFAASEDARLGIRGGIPEEEDEEYFEEEEQNQDVGPFRAPQHGSHTMRVESSVPTIPAATPAMPAAALTESSHHRGSAATQTHVRIPPEDGGNRAVVQSTATPTSEIPSTSRVKAASSALQQKSTVDLPPREVHQRQAPSAAFA